MKSKEISIELTYEQAKAQHGSARTVTPATGTPINIGSASDARTE